MRKGDVPPPWDEDRTGHGGFAIAYAAAAVMGFLLGFAVAYLIWGH